MSEVQKHFYFFLLEDEKDKFSLYVFESRNFNFWKLVMYVYLNLETTLKWTFE